MNRNNRPSILKHLLFLPWLTAALCLSACSPSADTPITVPTPSGTVLYSGARVIPGDGSPVIENAAFLVENGHFTALGPRHSIAVADGVVEVDLSGMTVMPTLIDGHVHLRSSREELVEDLRQRAVFGVSAAFGMGMDGDDVALRVRDEAQPDIALYRSAGRGITSPEPGRSEVPHWVSSPEEARQAVREEAARGVDIIKIWVDDRDGQYEGLSPPLSSAIIAEAHQQDLRVTAHIFGLQDAKDLLTAGIDAFAHGVREEDVDDEFLSMIRERPQVVVVPNLPPRGVATDLEWLRGHIPDEQLQRLLDAPTGNAAQQEAFGIQARNLDRLHRAGVKIAMGTDGNIPWGAHVEIEDMVASGLSPFDVITAATSTSAAYMALDDRGSIAPGKVADFIVLEANPLEDITHTRRIQRVYLAGTEVAR